MAALLVAIAIMGILMSAAMPVWRQQAQREKEAELVFRGEQWARAIVLFQRKFANASPPNVNVLVEQKFIRKRYKDPITNDDFQPVFQGTQAPGTGTESGPPGRSGVPPRTNPGRGTGPGGTTVGRGGSTGGQVGASGGILGFTSKSKDSSIRLYHGRSKYNEFLFVYQPPMSQQPGLEGGQRPGGPGQPMPGQGPGGRRGGGPGGMQPGGGVRPPGGMQPGRGMFPPGGVPPTRPPD